MLRSLLLCLLSLSAFAADAPKRKVLFFTKSSGYEHEVISYKKGQPSFAEKQLLELGAANIGKTFREQKLAELSDRGATDDQVARASAAFSFPTSGWGFFFMDRSGALVCWRGLPASRLGASGRLRGLLLERLLEGVFEVHPCLAAFEVFLFELQFVRDAAEEGLGAVVADLDLESGGDRRSGVAVLCAEVVVEDRFRDRCVDDAGREARE